MIHFAYQSIMDPERNPLSALPKKVRFQYMLILSYLWSAVFTIWVGSTVVLGPTIAGHVLLLIAVFFTGDLFRRARADAKGHRDAMRDKRDGTVMYDDIWGAPVHAAALNHGELRGKGA